MIDISIRLPEYDIDTKPDSKIIGGKIDKLMFEEFSAKKVVVRCISYRDHESSSPDEIVDKIKKLGTDKYDSDKKGIGYEVADGKEIDLFGLPANLAEKHPVMAELIDGFYQSALEDRGFRIRIDLVLIYDEAKLEMVKQLYEGHEESDGYIFKEPERKQEALLGIVRLL